MTPKTTQAQAAAASSAAAGGGNTLLTPYLVFESTDGGHNWKYLGKLAAGDSAAALRKFFNDPPREQTDVELLHVAVSVNSFKPRKVAARVKTSISEAAMPEITDGQQSLEDAVGIEDAP